MFGEIEKIQGKSITLNVDDEIDISNISRSADDKKATVEFVINDGRHISPEQRKKAFAMLNDISDYTGYSLIETEQLMKYRFISTQRIPKFFSLSDCSMTVAKNFIDFMITFCIQQDIPFTTKVWDEIASSYALQHQCLLKRLCVVCGKPHAEVAHYDTVGMGNNRHAMNHVGLRAMSLCRRHHDLQENQKSTLEFCQMYQVKPIKLSKYDVIKLGLMSKKQVEDLNA